MNTDTFTHAYTHALVTWLERALGTWLRGGFSHWVEAGDWYLVVAVVINTWVRLPVLCFKHGTGSGFLR